MLRSCLWIMSAPGEVLFYESDRKMLINLSLIGNTTLREKNGEVHSEAVDRCEIKNGAC